MTAEKVPGGKAAEVSPLRRHSSFLKLWTGQSVSLLGSSVTTLALPLTAIYTLHAGAEQIGLLKAVLWLPYLLIALWVGAWCDRHRRRRVMIAANVGQTLAIGSVAVLGLTRMLTLPLLCVAVFVAGSLAVFFDLSYNAFVPSIVARSQLVSANSRLQSSASVAQIAGPGLAGLIVEFFVAPVALLVDAASFVVSAVMLSSIHDNEPPVPRPTGSEIGVWAQIRTGLAIVLRNPLLRSLMGNASTYNLFSQWMAALLVLFEVHDLGLRPGTIGLVAGTAAIGALAGSALAGRVTRSLGIGGALLLATFAGPVGMLAVPFAPAAHRVLAAVIVAAGLAVSNVGTSLASVVSISVRQAVTPRHAIGRMTATYKFMTYGLITVGALGGGVTGQLLGLRTGLLIGAIGLLGSIAWIVFSPFPRLRELPVPEQETFVAAAATATAQSPSATGAVPSPE
jgi:MFS family permease